MKYSGMKVHYTWRDIPSLLRTPAGRRHLWIAVLRRLWPLLQQLAMIYRRMALRHTCLVVVIGSFGKTTTARAVSVALGGTDQDVTSYNFKSGVAMAVLKTPPWRRFAVIEAGIDGVGQMIRYAKIIRPDVAVVTCIGSEHNRSLGSLQSTRNEKVKILAGLPPGGVAVLNGDDPNVRWMATQTQNRIITFGVGEMNEVRASDLTLNWPKGTQFKVHANGKTCEMSVRFLGRHMVYPILAAIATALAEGFPLEQILPPLQTLSPTPGRLEPIRLPNGALILRDDFKSSLETIHAALDLFSQIPAKRRMVVLGEVSEPPGSQGPIYREIGERIASIASRAIFIGGNFQRYAAGVRRGGLPSSSIMDAGRSVLKAVELLREDLRPGDVVLIKGRDTQRLDRITLALIGRKVCCDIDFCDTRAVRCKTCPVLERTHEGQRMIL
jgi:UDP-N-acetylmuramoyl-tripeptide--D-alanyl-D-alanine ligase